MKLRIVDILAVVFVALGWSTLVWPQDCAKAVPIMRSPNDDIGQAQLRATQKCEADRMRKGKAHRQSVQTLCAESADMLKERLDLSAKERDKQYVICLKGHRYPQ